MLVDLAVDSTSFLGQQDGAVCCISCAAVVQHRWTTGVAAVTYV
jgi:hypothetical protein